MATYNKLVRDKIPEILDRKKIPYEKHIATDDEYRAALIEKLHEEIAEFTADASVEELADVWEVVHALQQLPEYASLPKVRAEKLAARGGFSARIILKGEK